MRRPQRNTSAFSLVELLAVIGIIAILIAMFAPAIPAARQKALRVQCASNMRQLGAALVMYDQTYRRLPNLDADRVLFIRKTVVDPDTTGGGPEVYASVSFSSGPAYPRELIRAKTTTEQVLSCPVHKMDREFGGMPSYAPNVFYDSAPITKGKPHFILAAEVAGPVDEGSHLAHRDSHSPGELAPRRHGLKSNYLFFDGHVDWLSYRDASGPDLASWGDDQRERKAHPAPTLPPP